jgi:hypothetical protein
MNHVKNVVLLDIFCMFKLIFTNEVQLRHLHTLRI